ncbi:MAG: BatA domain-containing protein [Planctomycetes bacterium]|nr:BatA domain-containing protein [Planctomycetota bacterium]
MPGLTFLYPWLFWAGLIAAAAPVIIHLLMRTKPRLVVFPALRFVRQTHRASANRQRLKHIILLLMRMAAFILIGCILAGTKLAGSIADRPGGLLQSAVIILDTSGSMTARPDRQSPGLLAPARRAACRLIDGLPDGSRTAVLYTSDVQTTAGFVTDRSLAANMIANVPEGFGHEPLWDAINKASTMLENSPIPLKRVYIFTDMTAEAWRDGRKVAGDAQHVAVDCGLAGRCVNFALGDLKLSAGSVAVGTDIIVDVPVSCLNAGGQVELRLELDGKPADTARADLHADGATSVSFVFPATKPGLLRGAVVMDVPDCIEMDNVRYFTVMVGPQTELTIVRDSATASRGDQTAFLMSSSIASGPFGRRMVMADKLDPALLSPGAIVVLANVSSLSEPQWKLLDQFVRAGGRLWVVIGELVSAPGYSNDAAQKLIPIKPGVAQELSVAAAWRTDNLSDPMLSPFAEGLNGSLAEVKCRRRLAIESVASDARVVLAFADGVPAIVVRRAGEGQVVFWNFSPAPAFSNLARLGQFVVLSCRTAELLGGASSGQTLFGWGQQIELACPRGMTPTLATVGRPGRPPQPAMLDQRKKMLAIRADALGNWETAFSDAQKTVQGGFAVNSAAAESNLTTVDVGKLVPFFDPDGLTIVRGAEGLLNLDSDAKGGGGQMDLTVPLLIVLLVLLAGESYFANRFYRRKADAASDVAAVD